MFTFGDSFDAALADAQARGYAERNPDADILGIDASRKIAILTALATGKLVSTDKIHTEGITKIRKEDVIAAEKIGYSIKLLARCICDGDAPYIMVAPFMLGKSSALSTVSGVYNAVEVVAEPLGNVMFYGKGAGAGATASAVVGDLMQTMRIKNLLAPSFEKSDATRDFADFVSKHYLAFQKSAEKTVSEILGTTDFLDTEECAIITDKISEAALSDKLSKLEKRGFTPLSHIRIL
jgi:homoserine dehydrogenase